MVGSPGGRLTCMAFTGWPWRMTPSQVSLESLSGMVVNSSPSRRGSLNALQQLTNWRDMQLWSHEREFRRFDVFPYARFSNAAAGCRQGSSFAHRSSCCAVVMGGEPHHAAWVSSEQQRHFAGENRRPARTREATREALRLL